MTPEHEAQLETAIAHVTATMLAEIEVKLRESNDEQ